MMAGWVRVETRFINHPKVLDIGPLGESLWLRGLCYAGDQLTDGFIPTSYLKRMADMKAMSIAARLVASGLWDEEEDGYRIHDYLDWQRSRDEVNEISEKRAEAGRLGGKQKATNLLANGEAKFKQNPSNLLSSKPSKRLARLKDTDTDTDTDTEQINSPPTSSKQSKKIDLKGFDDFYGPYPKHQKRSEAEVAWSKLKPDERQSAIEAIHRQVLWPQMTGDQQFIPLPGSWLGARRWEDEPPQITANSRSPNGTVRRTGGAAHGGMTLQEQAEYTAELEREEREQVRNVEDPVHTKP